jgi:uroporphyrinogen decarboxylase
MEEEFVLKVMDIIKEQRILQARAFAEAGADILRVGDDIGSQKSMLMSPDCWRTHLKPRLKEVINAGREINPDIIVNYHSDGFVLPVIEDLIEVGVDILNPIQPECMEPKEIKNKFGDRLTLLGTIGTQTVLPFGTTEEVREYVYTRMEECKSGGGFIIAPSHGIRPEVPFENIIAFYDAVEEFGIY